MTVRALTAGSLVAIFSARRVLLLAAALAPPRSMSGLDGDSPSLALVVPVHNEADLLADLLEAIDRIDYPAEKLTVILVDDCSSDGSRELMLQWTESRRGAQLVTFDHPGGKANALVAGVSAVPEAELVAFCDADVHPRISCLRELTAAFTDECVAAASAVLWPRNAGASTVSRYAAIESWVHQLVTSRGKDRLDLNPPALGGMCVYRAGALRSVGGFRPASWGEDVEATVVLTRDGWRTRLVTRAAADHRVAESRAEYWRQHLRWGRAQMDSTTALRRRPGTMPLRERDSARPRRRPAAAVRWGRNVETLLASAGYLDRVGFAAAAILAARGKLSSRWAAGYAVAAAAEVVAAVAMAGAVRDLPSCAKSLLMLFPLDIASTVVGLAQQVLSDPPVHWSTGSERTVST